MRSGQWHARRRADAGDTGVVGGSGPGWLRAKGRLARVKWGFPLCRQCGNGGRGAERRREAKSGREAGALAGRKWPAWRRSVGRRSCGAWFGGRWLGESLALPGVAPGSAYSLQNSIDTPTPSATIAHNDRNRACAQDAARHPAFRPIQKPWGQSKTLGGRRIEAGLSSSSFLQGDGVSLNRVSRWRNQSRKHSASSGLGSCPAIVNP